MESPEKKDQSFVPRFHFHGLMMLPAVVSAYPQIDLMHDLGMLGIIQQEYIAAYMLDDTLLLIGVILTLSHRKLQEREGQWLKLISGLVILALGLVMIFRPAWLQLEH